MNNSEQTLRIELRRYELQGIVIPGLIAVAAICTYFLVRMPKAVDVGGVLEQGKKLSMSAPSVIFLGALVILSAYIVGHIIDGVAQFLYEEVYMRRWRGFTFGYLAGLRDEDRLKPAQYRDLFGQAVIGSISVILITLPWSRHVRSSDFWSWLHPFAFGLSLYALFYAFLALSNLAAKRICVPASGFAAQSRVMKFVLYVVVLASKPGVYVYSILDRGAEMLVAGRERLSQARLALLNIKFERAFHIKLGSAQRDAYWLIYLRMIEAQPNIREKIHRSINHTVFSRNVALAFSLASFILAMSTDVDGAASHSLVSWRFAAASLICFLIAYFWLARFHHWFDYTTKMVIRAFMASNDLPVGYRRSTDRVERIDADDHERQLVAVRVDSPTCKPSRSSAL